MPQSTLPDVSWYPLVSVSEWAAMALLACVVIVIALDFWPNDGSW